MTWAQPARQPRDLALYERMIDHGITAADRRGRAIDHVTARRIALWLLPRSQQEPEFMRGLVKFARHGVITADLKDQLRHHARSPSHPNRPHAARLLQYAIARNSSPGPLGTDFAAICDQIDRADAMLIELRDRLQNGRGLPEPAPPDTSGQHPIALTRYDPVSRTFGFILDASTANAAVHAITINALEREAHTREVQQESQTLPENSYGRRNREAIAAREAQTATRLRAIERAYRTALDPSATRALGLTQTLPSTDRTPDRELELE